MGAEPLILALPFLITVSQGQKHLSGELPPDPHSYGHSLPPHLPEQKPIPPEKQPGDFLRPGPVKDQGGDSVVGEGVGEETGVVFFCATHSAKRTSSWASSASVSPRPVCGS